MSDAPQGFWSIWPIRLVFLFVATAALDAGCQAWTYGLMPKLHLPLLQVLQFASAVAGVALIIFAYRGMIRWTEKRRADELGAHGAVRGFLAGALIGLVLFSAVYAIFFYLHIVTFDGFGTTQYLLRALTVSLIAAVGEEIVLRGVVFRILEGAMGTTVALILSGLLFGFLHAGNPGATPISSLAIALEAGILLAAAYALTRSLWLPIGLHFAWNFAEGGIYSAPVSGIPFKGLLNAPIAGPPLLSGGAFGPEASVVAVGVCLVAALVMLVMTAQRGLWKTLQFRLRTAG
jgi:membrane protease YdiL (CAAX protease family)